MGGIHTQAKEVNVPSICNGGHAPIATPIGPSNARSMDWYAFCNAGEHLLIERFNAHSLQCD